MRRSICPIALAFLVTTALVGTGCGPKQPDPNDPELKSNALKVRPGMSGGGGAPAQPAQGASGSKSGAKD